VALIPYADDDPQDERVEAVLARLPEPRINLFRMLANAPAMIGPTLRLGEAILTRGALDPKLREQVILHVARLTGSEYERVQHEGIARLVGVTDDGLDQPALKLVEALLDDNGTPPPELVTEVEAELGRAQLIEVMIVAGYYAMLGGVMRAVQLDIDNVLEKGMLDSERLGGRGQ
jgi:alkylhydroperoxidase family enzyme